MDLPGLTYRGAPLDDVAVLDRLPPAYAQLLAQRNGFVAFRGGLHVRGAALAPGWHAIRTALEGPDALHRLFPDLAATDVAFAQDAWGDQFILRGEEVHRYSARSRRLSPVAEDLVGFLRLVLEDPAGQLGLEPLRRHLDAGGSLHPGQLLHGDPPTALPALDCLRRLAGRD